MQDLTGLKFSRLFVLSLSKVQKGHNYWLCQCECGTFKVVNECSLKSGKIKSCGCLNKELSRMRMTKHGLWDTRLYKIYDGIKQRCYNKKNKSYKNYGGRGIKMCDEWQNDFMTFYNWSINNDYREDLTIDRINNNGNYEPSNCRWVDIKTQANNKRNNHYITYNNETHTIAEWSRLLNISIHALRHRFERGWSIERALTTP